MTSALASDTMKGLSSTPKFLLSKYFYDDAGSVIFQDIMKMPEYYLSDCEEEIFTQQKESIVREFSGGDDSFSLVELGSGDGQKTKILLRYLAELNVRFQYIPLDISQKANDDLKATITREIPGIEIYPLTGDYFSQLKELNGFASKRKIILFLGSNIGNFSEVETHRFLSQLSEFMNIGDKLLIGFDLKKSPGIIMDAYNDPHGHTRKFNLNLLVRLNRQLSADFDITMFDQYTEYNPESGEVRSYLISKVNQNVHIGALNQSFRFYQWEPVFMERSRKYDFKTINNLAAGNGFRIVRNFSDSRNFFVNSLWKKI